MGRARVSYASLTPTRPLPPLGRDLDDELVVFGALEAAKKGGKPSQIPLRYWIPDRTWDACGGVVDLARLK